MDPKTASQPEETTDDRKAFIGTWKFDSWEKISGMLTSGPDEQEEVTIEVTGRRWKLDTLSGDKVSWVTGA